MPVADHGTEETTEHLRQLRDTLKQPINTVDELVSLLGQPLDLLGSLPLSSATASKAAWTGPRGSEPRQILLSRLMGSLQTAVLDNVVAVWADNLDDTSPGRRATDLLDSWFCPTRPQEESDRRPNEDAARVALCSYQTLASALAPSRSQGALSDPSSSSSASRPSVPPPSVVAFVLPLLARLSAAYPLSTLYDVLFHSSTAANAAKSSVVWETLARTIVSVPAKVMNATQGGRTASVPSELHQEIWFDRLTREMEVIVRNESVRSDPNVGPLSSLLQHFVRNGYVAPLSTPALPSSAPPTTFFACLLPRLLPNLPFTALSTSYSRQWKSLFNLLDFADLARLTESLLRHLLAGMSAGEERRAGEVLGLLVGRTDDSLWEKVLLGGDGQGHDRAKVGVWWVAGGRLRDLGALEKLMQNVLALWTDVQFIKFSLVSRQTYVLALFLLLLKSFPPSSPPLTRVSTSATFLNALRHYLSHPDRTIRYLGMMGAEEVSARTNIEGVKPLDFGVWDGDEGGKGVAKKLREVEIDWDAPTPSGAEAALLGWTSSASQEGSSSAGRLRTALEPSAPPPSTPAQPVSGKSRKRDKKTNPAAAKITVLSDSDDSLTGYLSSASSSSSRSDSPTPSDLDEYIEDPTLYAPKKKKVARPVYLGQLADLLSATEEPEKLEVALKWGEALIRRKRGFGLELEENTVHITLMIASLNNNFELEDFDNRKQGILNALVACSPEKAAPTLIEQYFHPQYSLVQRSALLTALAMGAREAAALPTIAAPSLPSVDWPSKKLPPHLHERFLTQADTALARLEGTRRSRDAVQQLAEGLSEVAIGKGRESAENKVEAFQREKRLRVAPTPRRPSGAVGKESTPGTLDSTGSAPFKDSAAEFFILPLINRFWLHYQDEANKLARAPGYHAAGTGMVLSPLALSKLLATLSVLMHAARHSPLFLAVLAPEALELAVRVGSRPPPSPDAEEESTVLVAALELALVVLDASRDLDGGRTLTVDFTGLVLGAAEWGELVFGRTEKGERVLGEGGEGEGRIRRASAGLVVVIGECREKWGRVVGF